MKRIIALVLSLVMALSLCVPAWGAEPTSVTDEATLKAALKAGEDVVFANDITVAASSGGYSLAGIIVSGQTVDGKGHTLTVTGATRDWECGIYITGGTVKNLTVKDAFRGFFSAGSVADIYLDNVTFDSVVYTFNSDDGSGKYGVYISNSTMNGWTSFSNVHKEVVFTKCTFTEGNGYAFCRPYNPTTFVDCTFEAGFEMDPRAEVFFDNCKLGDVALTADNLATLVTSNLAKAKVLSNEVIPEVEVKAEEPKVEANESLTGANKDAAEVITTTGGITFEDNGALADVAEVVSKNTEVTEAEAAKALLESRYSAANATVIVESRFEVVVDDVDVANGTIALDITPVYQVVATNGTDKVVLEEGELDLENEVVEIKVQIPDALAAKGKLYVAHDGSELYEATVTGTAGAYFATFTTTSGFSPYVFYTDLKDLIAAAASGTNKTVTLMGDVELPEELVIPDGVTLDGNGFTISVDDNATWVFEVLGSETKHLVELGNNTTVKNVTFDSENKVYGVQAYCKTGVKLENVKSINSKGAGLNVNGSTVEAVDLVTSGNAWGSVNVDPGSGVSEQSKFTVSGDNTNLSGGAAAIWSDGSNVTSGNPVEVVISGGTYSGSITVADGKGSVSITGGSFDTNVSAYMADGNDLVYTNGKYMAIPKTSAAGTTTTLKDADKYDIYGITGTTSVKADKADITKKVTSNVSVTVDGKTTVTYTATTYSDGANVYVEVDSSVADYKLTKNGTVVAYLKNLADVGAVPTTTQTVSSYVKPVEKPACGEYSKALYPAGVFMIDGVAYEAGGANWALYNGKFVNYGAKAFAVVHTYAVNTYNTTDKSVATLKCTACKQVFTVLTDKQVKTMAPASYAKVAATDGNAYFIAVPAGSAGITTGTVTSADTFDAGIALYVGMSVMAAAGAVVLKKRED